MCAEKYVLVNEMFTNGLNRVLRLASRSQKDSPCTGNIPWAAISKDAHGDSLLGHKRNYHN